MGEGSEALELASVSAVYYNLYPLLMLSAGLV